MVKKRERRCVFSKESEKTYKVSEKNELKVFEIKFDLLVEGNKSKSYTRKSFKYFIFQNLK